MPFVDVAGKSAINKFLNPPFFSLNISSFPNFQNAIEITNSVLEINNHKFEFIRLNHDGGSMGIKIDNTISYITDTSVSDKIYSFIKGSKIVLHEVWLVEKEIIIKPNDAKRHSVYEHVINILQKSKVQKLIPIHLNPNWNDNDIRRIFTEKQIDGLEVIIPNESEVIEF